MKILALVIALLFSTTTISLAQQADPAFLQKALGAMQSQRNQAMDALAVSEAKAQMAADQITKEQARIKELEDKYEPKKDAKK